MADSTGGTAAMIPSNPASQLAADTGLAVGQAAQAIAQRRADRAKHGLTVAEWHATVQMGSLGLLRAHVFLPIYESLRGGIGSGSFPALRLSESDMVRR